MENLGGCESLAKLDLTANFIDAPRGLLSIAELRHNSALTELFLSGNPCTKHEGYRDFVVATLPHLARLDGTDITPKERIKAAQVSLVVLLHLQLLKAKHSVRRRYLRSELSSRLNLPPMWCAVLGSASLLLWTDSHCSRSVQTLAGQKRVGGLRLGFASTAKTPQSARRVKQPGKSRPCSCFQVTLPPC